MDELSWGRVGICACVDEDEVVGFCGDDGSDCGAFDAWERAHLDMGGSHCGAGVTGTDDGVSFPCFDQINGAAHGGVPLPSDGIRGGVGHLDDLGGVDDFDARVFEAVFFEFGLDSVLVADEKEGFDTGTVPFLEGKDRTLHEVLRGEIAAHGIQGYLHLIELLFGRRVRIGLPPREAGCLSDKIGRMRGGWKGKSGLRRAQSLGGRII